MLKMLSKFDSEASNVIARYWYVRASNVHGASFAWRGGFAGEVNITKGESLHNVNPQKLTTISEVIKAKNAMRARGLIKIRAVLMTVRRVKLRGLRRTTG